MMINKLNLRPIPGPVPDTFFRDVPPNAKAVFSTLNGQRLPRPAPNRNSHFCVRSDDDDTIHQRALSLLRSYPNIACSVVNPLVVWEDLYEYFDAYDLWMESPGVLFQVMGQIVRINLARNNEIDFYATAWVNTNTTRFTVLLQGQDVISTIFTKADEQFFDIAALTPYEKALLARTLNQKCESSYPTIDSLLQCQQKKQRQVGGDDYRLKRYPHQHSVLEDHERLYQQPPKGHTRHETIHRFSTKDDQSQPDSNSRRHSSYRYNNSPNRSYKDSGEKMGPVLKSNSSIEVRSQPVLADRSSQPISGQRGTTFSVPPPIIHPGPSPGFGVYSPRPVYMLTSHLPHILPMKVHGSFSVPYVPFPPHPAHQFLQPYPEAESLTTGDSEQVSTFRNLDPLPPNAQIGELNAIRTQTFNNSSKQPQEIIFNQQPRRFSASSDDRTIWIGCLSPAILQLNFDRVLTLFSQCGNIESSRVLIQKFCAFITFEHPSSVDRAIDSLDRYELEEGRFLKVERPQKRDRKQRQNSSSTLEGNQPFSSNVPTGNRANSSFHGKERIMHRCNVLEFDRESCGAKQTGIETALFENLTTFPVKQSGAATTAKDLPATPLPLPLKLKSPTGEVEPQQTQKNGRHSVKTPSSKKKKKPSRSTESETSTPCAISAKNSGCSDISFATSLSSNGIKYATTTSLDSFFSGNGSSSLKPPEKEYSGNVEGGALGTLSKATDCGAADQNHWNTPDLPRPKSSDVANSLEIDCHQPIGPKIAHIIGSVKVGGPNELNSDGLKASQSAIITANEMLVGMISHNTSQSVFDVPLSTKKKLCWKERKASTRSKSTSETTSNRHPLTTKNNFGGIATITTLDDMPVAQKRMDHQSTQNTTSSSTGINSKTLRVKTNITSKRHGKAKSNSSSDSAHSSNYTLFNGPESQASSTTTQSFQTNQQGDIDKTIAHLKQTSKDPKLIGQKKVNGSGTAATLVRKSDSGTKNARPDKTPNRSPASGTRSQTGYGVRNSTPINRKENKELPSSPKLLLSDLIQWPALGSCKPLAPPKSIIAQPKIASAIKTLSDHLPQSTSLRRDSVTSVLSASSPTARQLTDDGSSSPTSASKLWPIVKRWDIYPLANKNQTTYSWRS